jgi:hypothetical protein
MLSAWIPSLRSRMTLSPLIAQSEAPSWLSAQRATFRLNCHWILRPFGSRMTQMPQCYSAWIPSLRSRMTHSPLIAQSNNLSSKLSLDPSSLRLQDDTNVSMLSAWIPSLRSRMTHSPLIAQSNNLSSFVYSHEVAFFRLTYSLLLFAGKRA